MRLAMRFHALALAGLCATAPAVRADTALPAAHDLRASAAAAAARGEALVVLFSLPGCTYCETVRASTYRWLVRDGDPVVQVDMRGHDVIRGFDGRVTDGAALARSYRVHLAPTALFVGPGGDELAARLVGAGVPDYYGGEVDQARQDAAAKLRAARR